MRVNRKAPYIIALLLTSLFILHACTSSSSVTSISGQLEIVTYGQRGGESDPLEAVPLTPMRLPEELLSEFMLETMQLSVALEPDFVPDEIIVKYKSGFEPPKVQSLSSFSAFIERRSNGDVASGVRSVLKLAQSEKSSLSIDAVKDRTLREIEWLNTLPHVEYAQPNYIYRPLALAKQPNDYYYYLQWHYPLIKWDHVWDEDLVTDLSGVTVAVIDTGIVREDWTNTGLNHEDFRDNGSTPFVDEYDFISNAAFSFDGDGYDDDATDMGDNPNRDLASFHGTHVIGTIGAYTNNSSTGVAGIAGRDNVLDSVKIMPLRALGYGGGTTDDIVEAIKYAAQLPNATGEQPSTQADVINMSLGSTAQDQDLKNAIDAAYSKNIVIVAAAGNNGSPVPFYPAAYENVISVSAVDIGANVTSYSNFGSTIDVAAPGGDLSYNLNFDIDALQYPDGVLSTFTKILKNGAPTADTQTYAFNQGTSMAAPHVAGLAALIKAKNPVLSASQIRARIENNAIDLGSAGRDDYYGHGLINAYASVHDAAGTALVDQDPVLFPYPKLFKLSGQNPSDTFTLENIGNTGSSISIGPITKKNSAAWLSVSPTTGTVDPELSINISIDSSSIDDGNDHIEMLTIEAGSGVADEFVYVMYNVNGFPLNGLFDIGLLYVVAIDFEEDIIVGADVTTFSDDLYSYAIRDLPSGRYIVGASTDRNGDGYIFEPDDAYGFYISLDQIVPVEVVSGNAEEGIDFEVIDLFDNPSGQHVQKVQ
jgi:serine protease